MHTEKDDKGASVQVKGYGATSATIAINSEAEDPTGAQNDNGAVVDKTKSSDNQNAYHVYSWYVMTSNTIDRKVCRHILQFHFIVLTIWPSVCIDQDFNILLVKIFTPEHD